MNDEQAMQLAIEQAMGGLYSASPNPRVGCVLTRDQQLLGAGFHLRTGEGHAEVNAIAAANASGHGIEAATAYVTLEPCNHTGRTPPCTQALISAGVERVVIAMLDPNPQVAGSGVAALQAAGISVETGLLEQQARQLNPGYIKRMESAMPWLRVKLAMSLDGRTAMASGESQWITGSEARSDVQRLRARSCAIVSGVDTVIADDAALTVRIDELGLPAEQAAVAARQQPLRVVLDSTLRLPPTARLLTQGGAILVVAAHENHSAQRALEEAGAELVCLPAANGQVDLRRLLQLLAERDCNEVMLEAGATLAGAFAEAGLIDQLSIYMAPTLMGSMARPLMEWPLETMAQQRRLLVDSISPVGDDWRIDARFA